MENMICFKVKCPKTIDISGITTFPHHKPFKRGGDGALLYYFFWEKGTDLKDLRVRSCIATFTASILSDIKISKG
jgi:hypothetical protein